ncbi:exopolyphosphatase/guanosine-5'-triphosphate,3'-diphosphate pyrophosphatase [Paenibacillus endophyticus]|uniref:Exopolyphosphatase/guanosine-5'-triphosphate, 3'-diphosphate pyrophosphatase n=1 Tax=Paenibacillus endophyticus TaxID=1294268 RepID=A0A7W5G7L5_9BACL|nr:Ppx/GppA family phosphatase [Paenibacillus endophyticus]MBB3150114.1 exopolyphosphatase/guanosine-5'-triphosphate,3'-diphosphate pyrophosphatase [Paenibacillus endophyticus]
MTKQRIGIIDIGSNSVRLVVYERTANGAHRVADSSKRPARLSERIDEDGCLPLSAIDELIDTLNHFTMICTHNHTSNIRAVATAAIRNAHNRTEILGRIKAETGLTIELLSGEDEASYGFLGMINSLNIKDGLLIDIGGGSTELSLFRNRALVRSVSFPFGCVSLNKRFGAKGMLLDEELKALEMLVTEAVKNEPWIGELPGLPLVGVGGTVRALGKMHQAAYKYPFPQTHNYPATSEHVDELFHQMRKLPLDKRRKLPGLSKERADVVVPGVAILRVLFRAAKASYYRICGAGLRDGLFHATRFPNHPKLDDVLKYSLTNLSALHPEAPKQHVMQVNRIALEIYDVLHYEHALPSQTRVLLDTASQLFRIGASIDYYEYARHSFYLIINSQLNGLTHREMIMTAAIASYKSKGRARQHISEYKELLNDSDLDIIYKLGALLQLSAALDRGETQAIAQLNVQLSGNQLLLRPVQPRGTLDVERREVDELAAEFKKLWAYTPSLDFSATHVPSTTI